MQKPAAYLTAVFVGAIVWFFFQHFQIEGMESLQVVPKGQQSADTSAPSESQDELPMGDEPRAPQRLVQQLLRKPSANGVASAAATEVAPTNDTPAAEKARPQAKTPRQPEYLPSNDPNTIRVASFHLHFFGSAADNSEITMNAVARVVRLFDVLALQGVSPGGEASLADLVAKAGRKYDYLVGSTAVNETTDQLLAFIYNRDTIIADRGDGLYSLGDPDDLFRRDPLIGWFRAKQAPAEQAFTFSLVNVHTEQRHALQELNVLDDVFYEVRQDWRDEDDVIMLGCFQRPETKLAELTKVRGLVPAVRNTPTSVRGDVQTENILFRRQETDEFTGRSGAFHFLRAYNLSLNQALQVSDYLPVWAEFSVFEARGARREARGDRVEQR